jgi:hypothetical protein
MALTPSRIVASIYFKGGLTYAIGLNAKIPFNKKAGFLLSFGKRGLAIRAGFFVARKLNFSESR